jgi:hypothetical protein
MTKYEQIEQEVRLLSGSELATATFLARLSEFDAASHDQGVDQGVRVLESADQDR